MRKTIGFFALAALVTAISGTAAQEPSAVKAPAPEKPAGKRLSVQFLETRVRSDGQTTSRPYVVTLQADAGAAKVFVGVQHGIVTFASRDVPTTQFKNVGVEARASVEALADGRYRVNAAWDDSSVRVGAPVTGDNPVLGVVRGESRLTLREGETVPFASAADPVTGDVVRVDLGLKAAPAPAGVGPGRAPGGEDARLRANVVLIRRQGDTKTVLRPYSVLVQAGGKDSANVFSGSMIPVQTTYQGGQVTVMLKDVGAGLRLKVKGLPDGRYRLELGFSDGVLAPAEGAPRLRTFQSETELVVQEGEKLTVASAVDPLTGERVEVELTLEAVR